MSRVHYGKGENDYCVYTSLDKEFKNTKQSTCDLCGHDINELNYCVNCGYINKDKDDE